MATKKKVAGGPWEVVLEQMASQNRLTMEALEVTRVELGSRIDALGQGLTTRIEDLERAHVTTRLQLSQDIADTRADLGALRAEHAATRTELSEMRGEVSAVRDQLVERIDSLEQRIDRPDRPGSVH
ncbi:MAG: hypothetical protein KJ067_21930 [Vicinamibacteria bacterium]|nr:hypothetical protein [Vicinamibacteria bacterium]